MPCRICIVQIETRKPVLDHADYTAPTRQHEPDPTDQELVCPEKCRSSSGNRLSRSWSVWGEQSHWLGYFRYFIPGITNGVGNICYAVPQLLFCRLMRRRRIRISRFARKTWANGADTLTGIHPPKFYTRSNRSDLTVLNFPYMYIPVSYTHLTLPTNREV